MKAIYFFTINFTCNLKARMTVLEFRFIRKDLFVCNDDTLFLFYSHISPLACIMKHLHIFVLKTREVHGNFCDAKILV